MCVGVVAGGGGQAYGGRYVGAERGRKRGGEREREGERERGKEREGERERERERMPKANGRGGQLGFFWSPKRSGFWQLFRCRPTQMLQTNEQSQTMWFFEAQASQLL